jgi:hypothetical protein
VLNQNFRLPGIFSRFRREDAPGKPQPLGCSGTGHGKLPASLPLGTVSRRDVGDSSPAGGALHPGPWDGIVEYIAAA